MTVIRPNSISGVSSITGNGGDISIFRADGTAADVIVNNITSGIITATTFSGNISGTTGTFTGNLGVGGVLTYEDVTNIDSVGVITARTDINLGDSIIHTGDTDTKIRFPAANTVTVEAGGHERIRIASSKILKGLTSARGNYGNNTSGVEYGVQIEGTSAITAGLAIVRNSNDANDGGIVLGKTRATSNGGNTVVQSGDDLGNITFAGNDGSTMLFGAEIFAEVQSGVGNDDMPADLIFKTNGGSTSTTERLRIHATGYVTKPSNPGFFARPPADYNMSGDTIIGGTWSTSDSEAFVRGTLTNGTSIWNNSTGIFTIPVTGIYYIHWNVFLKNNTTRRDVMIYRNGTSSSNIIARTEVGEPNGTTGTNKNVSVSAVVSLSVNDTIRFGALTAGGNQTYSGSKPWSYACAYLVG